MSLPSFHRQNEGINGGTNLPEAVRLPAPHSLESYKSLTSSPAPRFLNGFEREPEAQPGSKAPEPDPRSKTPNQTTQSTQLKGTTPSFACRASPQFQPPKTRPTPSRR